MQLPNKYQIHSLKIVNNKQLFDSMSKSYYSLCEFEPDLGNQIKKITMYQNDMKKYFKTQLNV